jgi:hypothetical protein
MDTPKGSLPPPYRASVWRVLCFRGLATLVLGIVAYMIVTGQGYLPSKARHGVHVSWHDEPLAFLVVAGLYLYLAAALWFQAPYHYWTSRRSGLTWPPPKPTFLGFYHPPFLKSLLLLGCHVGICLVLFGLYQFATGTFYLPGPDGATQAISAAADPAAFRSALVWYLMIGVATAACLGVAKVWHPADTLDTD